MEAATLVKERPILFKSEMVRAIFNTSPDQQPAVSTLPYKWQTRRVMKPQPSRHTSMSTGRDLGVLWPGSHPPATNMDLDEALSYCPYGRVGDLLWVRETWAHHPDGEGVIYCADDLGWDDENTGVKWKPSIHMPRVASRITLEVSGIRIERLQQITDKDAISEGIFQMSSGYWTGGLHPVKGTYRHMISPVDAFRDLWDSINGSKASWESNPWVWVVEFRRVAQ